MVIKQTGETKTGNQETSKILRISLPPKKNLHTRYIWEDDIYGTLPASLSFIFHSISRSKPAPLATVSVDELRLPVSMDLKHHFYRQDLLFPGDACYLWPTDELSITPSSCLSCLSFLSFLSNSSPRLISIICPCSVPRRACALAPFCRRYSSRRIAFLVLHLYIASARSPTNGTRPMRKSMAIFRAILNRSEDGRPPSISSQVPRTSNASNVSAPSPILEVL